MIQRERLVAPAEHLGVLIEPSPQRLRAAVLQPPGPEWDRVTILERPLCHWREQLRARLTLTGPVVATGHQPEFFHAGVFAKTVAAQVLADQVGGTPVFLTVDSDLPRSSRLVVPQITARELRRVDVALPGSEPGRPYECQPELPREHWLDFFIHVASLYEHYDVSFLRLFADAWLGSRSDATLRYCDAMARGRSALEEALGLAGVREIRISELAQTGEFRAFAAHLILSAPRLAADYNAACAAHRERHRVRSPNRPVPPLTTADNRTELPLWVFRDDGPRRRVYVTHRNQRIELYADHEHLGQLAPDDLGTAALDRPWSFEHSGWRLRPRALALSAFARLMLADLFIHGVGGARYDELTEDCARRFFEAELAPLACVSATLRLPLPRFGVRREQVLEARRRCRDVRFNPQRYLRNLPEKLLCRRAELIQRSDELRARSPRDRRARRLVWQQIRDANEQLLGCDPWRAAELAQQVELLEHRWRLDQVADDREYFVALHLRRTLSELVGRLRDALTRD